MTLNYSSRSKYPQSFRTFSVTEDILNDLEIEKGGKSRSIRRCNLLEISSGFALLVRAAFEVEVC